MAKIISYSTIAVDAPTKKELVRQCENAGKTQGKYVKQMLHYFKKTGINPSDPPESIREEVSEMGKRISQLIAFQKTFEQKQLLPLVETLYELEAELKAENISAQLERISKQLALLNPEAPALTPPLRQTDRDYQKEIGSWKEKTALLSKHLKEILDNIEDTRKGYLITLPKHHVKAVHDFAKTL